MHKEFLVHKLREKAFDSWEKSLAAKHSFLLILILKYRSPLWKSGNRKEQIFMHMQVKEQSQEALRPLSFRLGPQILEKN